MENHVSFNLTWVFNTDVVGISVHGHDFLLECIHIICQINTISK